MKNFFFLFLVFLLGRLNVISQVNIGGSLPPDPSATLEVSGVLGGFLPPRLTSVERNAIVMPSQGLIIFNTDNNCLEFFVGNFWQSIACGCSGPPSAPFAISGPTQPCPGAAGLNYSTLALPGITYTWTVPPGFTITSASVGPAITVQAGTVPGYIKVTPSNACGTGPADSVFVSFPVSGSGGTQTNHNGHVLHTFLSNGTFVLNGPCPSEIEILAVGGGGGAGGYDGAAGGGGGGGGAVYGRIQLQPGTYSIGVGGGGLGGVGCNANGSGGAGGANGGGNGGNAGTSGCSGGGGGGGGWTGIFQGSNYFFVAGGGAGGGGSNEGTANDVAASGGGSQPNGVMGGMTGGNGQNYSGDGGGGGGGGGGLFGGNGQANLTNFGVASGGGNHTSNMAAQSQAYNGNAGNTEGQGAQGGAPVVISNASHFNYTNHRGGGGSGFSGSSSGVQAPAGTGGILIIRYPQ
jgi:hypothetical protein